MMGHTYSEQDEPRKRLGLWDGVFNSATRVAEVLRFVPALPVPVSSGSSVRAMYCDFVRRYSKKVHKMRNEPDQR